MNKLDKEFKELIKRLDDPPEHAKGITLSNGTKLEALLVCVWCFSYGSASWSFCAHCGKKNKKLSDVTRREIILKRIKKLQKP